MYSSNVGFKFKVSFFQRFLNFCYDKNKGIVYSNNLQVFEKLKISKETIVEINLIDQKKEKTKENVSNESSNILQISLLEEQQKKLLNEQEKLIIDVNKLLEQHKENIDSRKETSSAIEVLKNSVIFLNKKNKEFKDSTNNLEAKFDAMLDILADMNVNSKQCVNMSETGITLEKIWNSTNNKETAAILSIMHMIRKSMEDKGARF
ncbi:MAG: hypothetical protein PHF86_07520 [Candidatus Nanoarchaeia archaeon]|jgi:citrate synthase|nr:hypothetical protein [Candidatus Nanoarchaeia archaeon]